ncbi:MAG: ribulose phosphate epimerase [Deltaproteobacteria bacterium]|nr:ribulose phosphate epimerase [Deltaproteobacteria bacterium]
MRAGTTKCTLVILLAASACGPTGISMGDEVGEGSSTDDSDGIDSTQPESSTSESSASDSSGSGLPEDGWPGDGCDTEFRCSPQSQLCDVFAQDCPAGEKCSLATHDGEVWDHHECVPIQGDAAPGEPCQYDGPIAATDDCDETGMCFGGVCRSFCQGTADNPLCDPALGCAATPDDDVLALCLPRCDVLAQDCDEASGCYWFGRDFLCAPAGTREIGQTCGWDDDCMPGNFCASAASLPECAGIACCVPYCDLAEPDCASLPGTECTGFFEEGTSPGIDDIGICVVP